MNADNETLATIKVDIPDDKNVNVIEPFGSVTKKFFDRDEKTWEVMVFIHSYDASYKQYGEFRVYNQNGEIVRTYDADNALFVDYSEGFNSYQRIALAKAVEEDGVAKTQILLCTCGWNEAPTVEKNAQRAVNATKLQRWLLLQLVQHRRQPVFRVLSL